MKRTLKKLDIIDRFDSEMPRDRYLRAFMVESSNDRRLAEKVNEIIDYLNEKIHKQRNVKRTVSTKEISRETKE